MDTKKKIKEYGNRKTGRFRKYFPLYLMLLPGGIYLIINNYFPMFGIILAFKNYNYSKGIWGSAWCGFDNFKFLFKTKDAFTITRNTIAYNAAFIVIGTVCAIGVAILLNELRNKLAKKIYQTLILLPFLISIVVVSYIVYGLLSTEYGMVNRILETLGKDRISWYSSPQYWPFILVLVNLWKNIGYNTVLYYSAIIGIDTTFYEAAVIDGASRWQRIKCIMLPLIKPTVMILFLMNISKIFYSDFGLFFQIPLNSGTLIDVTNTIDTYVYRGLIKNTNIGMSAAAGFYQSIVGFVLVVGANWIVKKRSQDSALF